jgi:Ca2+-binding EF-hand superfamily protein
MADYPRSTFAEREVIMKEFLIGAAGIVLAGAALAQAPVAPPAPPVPPQVAPLPPMMDRVQTRDEVVAKVREHFARLDANKDSFLTKDEAEAGRKLMKDHFRQKLGERRQFRMEHRDRNAAFDRLDANKDGSISRAEFAKAHEQRIERRIVLRDGQPVPDSMAPSTPVPPMSGMPHEGLRMHRMGAMMMGGHMFEMADLNKDGRVSLQEATDAAVRHFDMADANHDGRITPDERMQMHRQMIEKHRAPKAG